MPDFRKDLSLSTIIAIASLALALVGGWTALNSTLTGVEAKVSDHDRRLGAIEADGKDERAHSTRMLQDIAEIKTDIKYLREAIERDTKR